MGISLVFFSCCHFLRRWLGSAVLLLLHVSTPSPSRLHCFIHYCQNVALLRSILSLSLSLRLERRQGYFFTHIHISSYLRTTCLHNILAISFPQQQSLPDKHLRSQWRKATAQRLRLYRCTCAQAPFILIAQTFLPVLVARSPTGFTRKSACLLGERLTVDNLVSLWRNMSLRVVCLPNTQMLIKERKGLLGAAP